MLVFLFAFLLVFVDLSLAHPITLVQFPGSGKCLHPGKRWQMEVGQCVNVGSDLAQSVRYNGIQVYNSFVNYVIEGFKDIDCQSDWRTNNTLLAWFCQPIVGWGQTHQMYMVIDGRRPTMAPTLLTQYHNNGYCQIANQSWTLRPGRCTNIGTGSFGSIYFEGCPEEAPYSCQQSSLAVYAQLDCPGGNPLGWFGNTACQQFNPNDNTSNYYSFNCSC